MIVRKAGFLRSAKGARFAGASKLAVVAGLILSASWTAAAQGITLTSYVRLQPASYPVNATGMTSVGMARVLLKAGGNGKSSSISKMSIQLTGTAAEADITDVRVYYEPAAAVGTWNSSAGWTDLATGTVTFTDETPGDNLLDITISPSSNAFGWGATAPSGFYMVFDFASTSDASKTAGCEIVSVEYGPAGVGYDGTPTAGVDGVFAFTAHGSTGYLDDYETTLTAAGVAPATDQPAGTSRVPVLDLLVDHGDASLGTTGYNLLDSIRVRRTSGYDSDVTGVVLYDDTGATPGELDGTDAELASTSLSGGHATLNPASDIAIPEAGKRLFVAVNTSAGATSVPHTFGLEVENPSVDLVFKDIITDSFLDPLNSNRAILSAEYSNQIGYVVATAAAPSTGNTFTISENVGTDTTPPVVTATSPADGSSNVLVTANVSATFDDAMTVATVTDPLHFRLYDGFDYVTAVALSYDSPTRTATLDPDDGLAPGTTYTVTVTTGVEDDASNAMVMDRIWTFTTELRPQVVGTSPVDFAVNVAVSANVTATFSKAMTSGTITTSSFTVVRSSDSQAVAGAVSYDAGTKRATLNPTGNLEYATQYTATLTTGVTDTGGNGLATDYSWSFTTEASPDVVATSPLGNAVNVAVSANVTATFSKAMTSGTITTSSFTLVRSSDSQAVAGAVSYDAGTKRATLNPTGNLEYATQYTATLTTGVTDTGGNGLATDYSWSFTTEAQPEVTGTTPVDGAANVLVASTVTATFSKAMNAGSITTSSFTLSPDPGGWSVSYSAPNQKATLTPSAALAPGTVYTALLTTGVTDTGGNGLATNYSWSFTTEASPDVVATSPLGNAVDVAVSANVTATFSKAMASGSITGTSFTLKRTSDSQAVAGAVSYDSGTRRATLNPTGNLEYATQYTATLTTGVTDAAGNALAASYVWSLTTEAQPEIAGTTPFAGALGVLVREPVTVTFSKAMDAATITGTSFTLTLVSGGSNVAGVVSFDSPTQTATLTPAANLAPATQYRATLAASITDTRGNTLASSYSWTFTTEARPQVTAVSPSDGTIGVPVTVSPTATFNKAMASGSITGTSFSVVKTSSGASVATSGSYDAATLTATVDPSAGLQYSTQYTVTLTTAVTDERGNALATAYSWSFSTEPRPSVASVVPPSGGVGTLITTEVAATFTDVMSPSSVTASISVSDGTQTVSGTASYDGQTVTFVPDAPLHYQTTYTVTIAATASDPDGNTIGSAYSWSFTTEIRVQPTIVSTSPASGGADVPINNRTIRVTFSEALKESKAADIEYVVTDSRGTERAATAAYADSVLTLTLARDLQYSTTYTVTVRKDNVVDVDGLVMEADYSWSFTTLRLNESLAVNNRIDPRAPPDQQQVRVFIPEPPRGAEDRVTVAVYTARGRRVATLVAGRPYQEIVAELPILWDGSNGQRQKLAPGLYFIQITATGFKKTLKVLIAG